MGTAEESTANLHSVPDHPALAVLANRGHSLDRALEAVESVMDAGYYQFETFVVFIATNPAGGHTNLLPP